MSESDFPWWNQPRPHPDAAVEAALQQIDALLNERILGSWARSDGPIPEPARAAPCGCDAVMWNEHNHAVQCHRCGRVVEDPRVPALERELLEALPPPDLLPCPFCGDQAVLHKTSYAVVKCRSCGAEGVWAMGESDAIWLWNRRAGLPPPGFSEMTELLASFRLLAETATGAIFEVAWWPTNKYDEAHFSVSIFSNLGVEPFRVVYAYGTDHDGSLWQTTLDAVTQWRAKEEGGA